MDEIKRDYAAGALGLHGGNWAATARALFLPLPLVLPHIGPPHDPHFSNPVSR
jgi:hypothetical protein